MQIETVGDVLHRLIQSAPWSEEHRVAATAIVTKEFDHPTPTPEVAIVAQQMKNENDALKQRVADLEAAFRAAGIAAAKPAAGAVTPDAAKEIARLRAENEQLRGEITTKPAETASAEAARVAVEEAASAANPLKPNG